MAYYPIATELKERVADLADQGWSAPQIAAATGITSRTIERWRRAGLVANLWRETHPARHGASLYNRGCRCDVCREDATERAKAQRRARYARTRRDGLPPHVKHGLGGAQNWGCQCDVCREALRESNAAYQKLIRPSALPTEKP